jgi:PAS domain S-box-containing protein
VTLRKVHNSALRKPEEATEDASLTPRGALGIDLNTNAAQKKFLSDEVYAEVRDRQIKQATQAIPLHAFFLICASITITYLASPHLSQQERILWQVISLVPAVLQAFAYFVARRKTANKGQPLRILEFAGFAEGLVWSLPVSMFLAAASHSNQTIIIGITLAVAGVGTLALVRVPIGAVILSGMLIAATSYAIYIHIDDTSAVPSILCLVYGLVLVGIVISMHWEFLRSTRNEMEVARQREVIALLLNDFESGTSDWLWETDREGRITYFSPRFAEAIGKHEADILGNTFSALVEPDQDEGGWTAFTSAMAKEADIPSVLLSFHLEGRVQHWQMTARALASDDGRFIGYRGVGRDVSEKWNSDQVIREAKDLADRANTAKSQFLSLVGHEIRTPLNAIVGFAELLMSPQGDAINGKTRYEYLQTISDNAHQLQSLINDVLDTTRIEKGSLRLIEQEIEAAEIIEVAAKQCRDQANKAGVTVVVRLTDEIKLMGDQMRMKQIILNILSNAIKFSPSGSVVNAETRRGTSGEFIFAVRDAGVGIKQEDIDRVFEPFSQGEEGATRRFGGLGLGLSLARKIARLHGGDVILESSQNLGTTARFVLPPSRVYWPANLKQPEQTAA